MMLHIELHVYTVNIKTKRK